MDTPLPIPKAFAFRLTLKLFMYIRTCTQKAQYSSVYLLKSFKFEAIAHVSDMIDVKHRKYLE